MPIAGQILASVSVLAIVVPATIAPMIDMLFLQKQHNSLAEIIVALVLLAASIVPIRL
jgi:hypothetical protein